MRPAAGRTRARAFALLIFRSSPRRAGARGRSVHAGADFYFFNDQLMDGMYAVADHVRRFAAHDARDLPATIVMRTQSPKALLL